MDADKLVALGFSIVAGQVDRGGKNYGRVLAGDILLTTDGLALVESLAAEAAPAPAPAPKPAAKRAAKNAPATAAPAPVDSGLGDDIDAILSDVGGD